MSDPSNGHPRDLLSEILGRRARPRRAERSVDRHLAGCEDCRAELETLRRLARALAEESVPPVPVDLEARIGRRLDAGTIVRATRWRFAVPATIAATLGAVRPSRRGAVARGPHRRAGDAHARAGVQTAGARRV